MVANDSIASCGRMKKAPVRREQMASEGKVVSSMTS